MSALAGTLTQLTSPAKDFRKHATGSLPHSPKSPTDATEVPPPLPKRNRPSNAQSDRDDKRSLYENGKVPSKRSSKMSKSMSDPTPEVMVDNFLYEADVPPPLPPRAPTSHECDAANSLNKQMSYPLVATCTPLNSCVSNSSFVSYCSTLSKAFVNITCRANSRNEEGGGYT